MTKQHVNHESPLDCVHFNEYGDICDSEWNAPLEADVVSASDNFPPRHLTKDQDAKEEEFWILDWKSWQGVKCPQWNWWREWLSIYFMLNVKW